VGVGARRQSLAAGLARPEKMLPGRRWIEGKLQMSLHAFKVKVPQNALADLRKRLANTRWPDEVEGAGSGQSGRTAGLHMDRQSQSAAALAVRTRSLRRTR
jgi:hypothetical protein